MGAPRRFLRCTTHPHFAKAVLCAAAAVVVIPLLTVATLFTGTPSIRPTLLRLDASRGQSQVVGVLEADVLYRWQRLHRFTITHAALQILVPCKGAAGSPRGSCPALAAELTDLEYPAPGRIVVKFALTEAAPLRLGEALTSGSSDISFDCEAGLNVWNTGIIFTGSTNMRTDLWSYGTGAGGADGSNETSAGTGTSFRLVRERDGEVVTPKQLGMNISSAANYTLEWTMRDGHIPTFLRFTPVHIRVDAIVVEATKGSVSGTLGTDSLVKVEELPQGGLIARLPLRAAAHANLPALGQVILSTPFGPFDTTSRLAALPGGEGEFEDRLISFTAQPPLAAAWSDTHQVSVRSARSVLGGGPGRRLRDAGGVVQTHLLKLNDNEVLELNVSMLDGTPFEARLGLSVLPSPRLALSDWLANDTWGATLSFKMDESLSVLNVSSDQLNLSGSYRSGLSGIGYLQANGSLEGDDSGFALSATGSLGSEANRDSSVALSFEAGSKMLVTLKYNRTVDTCGFPGREGCADVDNFTLTALIWENVTVGPFSSCLRSNCTQSYEYVNATLEGRASWSITTQDSWTENPRLSTSRLSPSWSLMSHCKPFGWDQPTSEVYFDFDADASNDTGTTTPPSSTLLYSGTTTPRFVVYSTSSEIHYGTTTPPSPNIVYSTSAPPSTTFPKTHEGWKKECEYSRTIPDPLLDRFEYEDKFTDLSYIVKEDTDSYNVSAFWLDGVCRDVTIGSSPWRDSEGYDCDTYAERQWCTASGGYGQQWCDKADAEASSYCQGRGEFGSFAQYAKDDYTADEACCTCGGGVTATEEVLSLTAWSRSSAGVDGLGGKLVVGSTLPSGPSVWEISEQVTTDAISASVRLVPTGPKNSCRDMEFSGLDPRRFSRSTYERWRTSCSTYRDHEWCRADGEIGPDWCQGDGQGTVNRTVNRRGPWYLYKEDLIDCSANYTNFSNNADLASGYTAAEACCTCGGGVPHGMLSAGLSLVRPDAVFGNTASRELVLARPWSATAWVSNDDIDATVSWYVNSSLGYLDSSLSVLSKGSEVMRWATSFDNRADPSVMAMESIMTVDGERVLSLKGPMVKSNARTPRMVGDMILSASDMGTPYSVSVGASDGFRPLLGPAGPDRFDVALGVSDLLDGPANLTFYVERGADLATQAMGYGVALYDGKGDVLYKATSRVEVRGTTTGTTPTLLATSFELVDISAQVSGQEKFSGAVVANSGKIVFVPYGADGVGVFDPVDNKFTTPIGGSRRLWTVDPDLVGKFYGAAVLRDTSTSLWPPPSTASSEEIIYEGTATDGLIFFAPFNADDIGVFNPGTNEFRTIDISVKISGNKKFSGAVAANNGKIVFVPYGADGVGICDPSFEPYKAGYSQGDSPSFKLVDISVQVSSGGKFLGGAAAANGKIVFAPFSSDGVGVFDPADESFELVDISAKIGGDYKFGGAVADSSGKVVFAPYMADGVGIFDPVDNSFVLVSISTKVSRGGIKFHGAAAAPDGKIFLAPFFVDSVGIFDPADNSFELHDISEHVACDSMFAGAVASANDKIILAPYTSSGVGVFDLSGMPLASMSLTIAGLDYDALMANPTIKESLVTSIKDNILSIIPNLSRDNVVVELRAGSVIAEVFIINTPSVSVDLASLTTILSNPEVMVGLSAALVADILQIPGIDSCATGPISVVAKVNRLPVFKVQDVLDIKELNLLCPFGEDSMNCAAQAAGASAATCLFVCGCCLFVCVCARKCRAPPDKGERSIRGLDQKKIKVPYEIRRSGNSNNNLSNASESDQETNANPDGKVHVIWDLKVLNETEFIKSTMKKFAHLSASSVSGEGVALEDVKVMDAFPSNVGGEAHSLLEKIKAEKRPPPSIYPIIPKGARIEYYSASNKKWLIGWAEPKRVRRSKTGIQYNVMLRDGSVRVNVDPAFLRHEFRPLEKVDIFVNRAGGEWRSGDMDEKQSLGATTIGYRVNWSDGELPMTPPDRLRRRFVPNEQVYVYRGAEIGWVLGSVRGGRASSDDRAHTRILDNFFPPERQRARMQQLLGDVAQSVVHIPVTVDTSPSEKDSNNRPTTPRKQSGGLRAGTMSLTNSPAATPRYGRSNSPAIELARQVSRADEADSELGTETPREATLFNVSQLEIARQDVRMRWWYWIQVESLETVARTAPLAPPANAMVEEPGPWVPSMQPSATGGRRGGTSGASSARGSSPENREESPEANPDMTKDEEARPALGARLATEVLHGTAPPSPQAGQRQAPSSPLASTRSLSPSQTSPSSRASSPSRTPGGAFPAGEARTPRTAKITKMSGPPPPPEVPLVSEHPEVLFDFRGGGASSVQCRRTQELTASFVGGPKCDGEGIHLDGESQYVNITPYAFGGPTTVEVLLKFESFRDWMHVFDFNFSYDAFNVFDFNFSNFSEHEMWLGCTEAPEEPGAACPARFATQGPTGGMHALTTKGGVWELDAWVHVVVTVQGTTKRLYKNGEVAGTSQGGAEPIVVKRDNNLIGARCWAGKKSGYFHGSIAYVRMWHDQALGETEIKQLYADQQAEEEAKKKAVEEAKMKAEEEAKKKAEEEEAKKKAEEEAFLAQANAKEKELFLAQQEEARKKAEEEEAKKKAEEEAFFRKKAEEETKMIAEAQAMSRAEQEAAEKAAEQARRKAEEEAIWAKALANEKNPNIEWYPTFLVRRGDRPLSECRRKDQKDTMPI